MIHEKRYARTRKKNAPLYISIMLVVAVLLALPSAIPIHSTQKEVSIAELDGSPLSHDFKERMNQITQPYLDDPSIGRVFWGDILIDEYENLYGATQSILSAPYMICSIRDVETAGTSHWSHRLEILSVSLRNEKATRQNVARLQNVQFAVEADKNTSLNMEDSRLQVDESTLRDTCLQESGGFLVNASAATLDSTQKPTAQCVASVQWRGDIVTKYSPIVWHRYPFTISGQVVYLSNLQ